MKQKKETPKTLAIEGKVISIENIGSKSKAQFADQLKKNGIVLDDDRLESVYTTLHNWAEEAEKAAAEAAEVEPTKTEE